MDRFLSEKKKRKNKKDNEEEETTITMRKDRERNANESGSRGGCSAGRIEGSVDADFKGIGKVFFPGLMVRIFRRSICVN